MYIKMKLKNIPNILSIIRICLVFVFVAFFLNDMIIAALVVFLVAGATDVVDGYLARKYNWITNLGKILDPVADKLMQCTVLVCLYIGGYIPLFLVIPFFLKEFCSLLMGFIVIKRRNVTIVSRWFGKFTVCLFYATIAATIIFKGFFDANQLIRDLICIPAVFFAVFSFIAYVKHYAWLKKEEVNKGNLIKRKEK